MRFAGADDYWDLQTSIGGPIPAMAASLPPDEVAEIRSSLDSALEPFRAGDGYDLPSSLVTVSAR